MELWCKMETVINVDYCDLNEFIADAYGLEDFEGTLESSNDSVHRFDISEPDSMYDDFVKEEVEEIIKTESCEYYSLGNVLEDLAQKGKIQRGIYLVDVCW